MKPDTIYLPEYLLKGTCMWAGGLRQKHVYVQACIQQAEVKTAARQQSCSSDLPRLHRAISSSAVRICAAASSCARVSTNSDFGIEMALARRSR
eukprot:3725756-Pleurochrysis_carterae.AAC.2